MKIQHTEAKIPSASRWFRVCAPAALVLGIAVAIAFTTTFFMATGSRADGPPDLGSFLSLPIKVEQGRTAPALAPSGPRQPSGPGTTPLPPSTPFALESNHDPALTNVAPINQDGRPTGLEIEDFGATSVLLSWEAPEQEEGDPTITGYQVQRLHSGTPDVWRNVGSTRANVLTFEDTGLKPATSYQYRVAARHRGGLGPWTAYAAHVMTKALTPAAPKLTARAMYRGLDANLHGPNRYEVWVELEWTEPDDNGSESSSYVLEWSPNGRDRWRTSEASLVGPLHERDQTVLEGETRYYRVQASNAIGSGSWSNVARATTRGVRRPADDSAVDGGASPPTEVEIQDFGANWVELTWQAPVQEEGDPPITRYQIQRTHSYSLEDWRNVGTAVPPNLTFRDTGLAPGTFYHYRVAARDNRGLGQWGGDAASVLTKAQPPSGPRLTATAMCRRGSDFTGNCPTAPVASEPRPQVWIELGWTEPNANGAVINDYMLQRSPNGRDGWEILPSYGREYEDHYGEDSVMGYGETWHYRVRALWDDRVHSANKMNDHNDSPWSTVARATTRTFVPGPMPHLERYLPEEKQIQITWEPPYDTGGRPISGYQIQVSTRGNESGANWSTLVSPASKSRRYTHTNLRVDTEYCYRIRARNALGWGQWQNTIGQLTGQCFRLLPATPLKPTVAVDQTAERVTVSWTTPDSLGLTLSGIEMGIAPNVIQWRSVPSYKPDVTSATFSFADLRSKYLGGQGATMALFRIRVKATNGVTSEWSEYVIATIPP